jgi:UDPglucose--hexose-1-phosphate uridylyltransferase
MPELRRDPLTGTWVVLAHERGARPTEYRLTDERTTLEDCPFCPGHEAATPRAIVEVPGPAGWLARVFANRYPALVVEATRAAEGVGVYDRMDGVGAHEVVVESREHDLRWHSLGAAGIQRVLELWQARLRDLSRDARLEHAVVFKNSGAQAGATLDHPHSQIVALPFVPPAAQTRLDRAATHHAWHGRCLLCDILRQERGAADRLVVEGALSAAWCPYASRVGFEVMVAPTVHESSFEASSARVIADVASTLGQLFAALHQTLPNVSYNIVVQGAPLRSSPLAHAHWYLEILPVLSRQAGFEWGSGMFINSTAPETAAGYLRERRARPSTLSHG